MHTFYIAADLERTLIPVKNKQRTKKYQHHKTKRYIFKLNCMCNKILKPITLFNNSKPDILRESFMNDIKLYDY